MDAPVSAVSEVSDPLLITHLLLHSENVCGLTKLVTCPSLKNDCVSDTDSIQEKVERWALPAPAVQRKKMRLEGHPAQGLPSY